MRCTIISRAGQVLAYGQLFIRQENDGRLRLDLETAGGRILTGGLLDEDGDMTVASQVLADQFFDVWGMSDLILNIQCGRASSESQQSVQNALPASAGNIEIALL